MGFLLNPFRFGGGSPPSPYQDLTTFAEIDGSSRIATTADRSTWTSLTRSITAYLYKDFGAAFFAGDITVDFDARMTSSSSTSFAEILAFANQIGDATNANRTNTMGVFFYAGNSIHLREMDGGSNYSQSYAVSVNTTYYLRFRRDESVGTYGTIYLHIAGSDANRASSTWLTTLSVTLHSSAKDYRYFYATASYNDAMAHSVSGWSEKYLIT